MQDEREGSTPIKRGTVGGKQYTATEKEGPGLAGYESHNRNRLTLVGATGTEYKEVIGHATTGRIKLIY